MRVNYVNRKHKLLFYFKQVSFHNRHQEKYSDNRLYRIYNDGVVSSVKWHMSHAYRQKYSEGEIVSSSYIGDEICYMVKEQHKVHNTFYKLTHLSELVPENMVENIGEIGMTNQKLFWTMLEAHEETTD